MDTSRFDRLARTLGATRTRRAAVAVIAAVVAVPLPGEVAGKGKHKRRKKKCAKACTEGCCTSQYGKCITPAEQSTTRCGTGGSICQSSGCTCNAGRPCPVGQCCDGAGQCGACTVFITSTPRLAGDLGGLAGADATCQQRAAAAGLPGSYMAWLSDTSASPASRFTKASVPYTLPGGEIVATSWADLTNGGALGHAINQDESGVVVSGNSLAAFMAWTHTMPNGAAGGTDPSGHCANWTSASAGPTGNTGDARSTTIWSQNGFLQCAAEAWLYCFQQR